MLLIVRRDDIDIHRWTGEDRELLLNSRQARLSNSNQWAYAGKQSMYCHIN